MARILIVTHGAGTLRASIAAFRLIGHRVTLREAVTPADVHRASPDLLVIAPGNPEIVRALIIALRADAMLRFLPVIVAGAEGDLQALLPPVAPAADIMILSAPLDTGALFEAAHFFVTITPPVTSRRLVA